MSVASKEAMTLSPTLYHDDDPVEHHMAHPMVHPTVYYRIDLDRPKQLYHQELTCPDHAGVSRRS